MDQRDKQGIINLFPGLSNDNKFKITSPQDPNYNCIAWAYKMYQDKWMQPPKGYPAPALDAVTWWPDGFKECTDIQCLIDIFSQIGYKKCDFWEHETNFIKVALYYNPISGKWTHASRESRDGSHWMSKLGCSFDIHHGNPYTIEGVNYGKVYCIMKK